MGGGGVFSKDCCLQLASHNGLRTFHLLRAVFFYILRIYWLNFTSQQTPIWVANTLFPFVEENVLFMIAKTFFRQNIDHKGYSQKLYFPFVYLKGLLHTLSLTFLLIFFNMQFLGAWISSPKIVGVTFFAIFTSACKKEPAESRPNFYSWANGAFSASMLRISASFWSERILQCHHSEHNVR